MRIGAKLPDFGPAVHEHGPADTARRAEQAGFDSVWVSDHIVMVEESRSAYPYSADGAITWDAAGPRLEAIVAMAMAAAATERVRIGVAILLAGLRNPLVLAKQIATLDMLSAGRVELGVGAGWLIEEFEALGVPYDTRGARLNEWIEILRACWTGRPEPRQSEHYDLPGGLLMFPAPATPPPILIGGMSQAAVRRAGRLADGWLAFQHADAVDYPVLEDRLSLLRATAADAGRPAGRAMVRLTGPEDSVVGVLPGLASVGIDEVIIEVDWESEDGPARTMQRMRSSVT